MGCLGRLSAVRSSAFSELFLEARAAGFVYRMAAAGEAYASARNPSGRMVNSTASLWSNPVRAAARPV